MFILAQSKVPANPSFFLFVTSPIVAQETQNLKTQGLPSMSEEHLILDGHEICLSSYQISFF